MSKKILITGGAGFIGSNVINTLWNESFDIADITTVDDMSNGRLEFLNKKYRKSSLFIKADFADDVILSKIKNKQFDYVVHLAAKPRVSYSVEYPLETHETNVNKTLKLIDACKGNIKRFIFASSSSVYGGAENLPTSETEHKDPKSPYALQKSIIEDYLELYSKFYYLDSVSLRFFNVFGPNQLGDSPYATALAAWLTSIKRNENLRSDGNGLQTRDMCPVDTVVKAIKASILFDGQLNAQPINVATGTSLSNKEILTYLQNRYKNIKILEAPERPGDVKHTLANVELLQTVLNVTPNDPWYEIDKMCTWYDKNYHTLVRYGRLLY